MRSASRWIMAARSTRPIRGHGPFVEGAAGARDRARRRRRRHASAACGPHLAGPGVVDVEAAPSSDSTSSPSMTCPKNWMSLMWFTFCGGAVGAAVGVADADVGGHGSVRIARVGRRPALGDGDVARGPVRRGHLAHDDADALDRGVDGLDGGAGQRGDEGPHLLRGAALDHGDLDERHGAQPSPPLRNTEPRLVKCSAVLDPGGANTASVMPPVSTIQPASMAWPRRARSLAARASASPGWPCTAAPVAESTTTPSTSTRHGLQREVEVGGRQPDRAGDERAGGGVVGRDVAGGEPEVLVAAVDDLGAAPHRLDRRHRLGARDARALEPLAHDEDDLGLDAGVDEPSTAAPGRRRAAPSRR